MNTLFDNNQMVRSLGKGKIMAAMNIQNCTGMVKSKQFELALQTIQIVVQKPEEFIAMYALITEEGRCGIRQDVCNTLAGLKKQQYFASKWEQGWSDQDAKTSYYLLRDFMQTLIHRQVFVIDDFSLLQLAQLLCPSIGDENNCLFNRIRARLTTPEGKKEFEASKSAIIHALDDLYHQTDGVLRDRAWIVLNTSPWSRKDREDLASEITSLCL